MNKNRKWKMIEENMNSSYWISNDGKCKKINKKTGEIQISNGSIIKSSPKYYYFYNDYVHRLVAKAFLRNSRGLEQIDHINDNSFDNRACNLRWVSRKTNNSKHHSRKLKKQNAHHTNHKGQVLKAQRSNDVLFFKSGCEAAKSLGCSHVLIYKAASGQIEHAKGWNLKWTNEVL